jgi:transcriptional regulator with XRE-family HTH domain
MCKMCHPADVPDPLPVNTLEEVVQIGAQLRAARERALLTQEELVARADVQPFTISRIERNKGEPRFSTIRKLAEALDVDPRDLVGDANE